MCLGHMSQPGLLWPADDRHVHHHTIFIFCPPFLCTLLRSAGWPLSSHLIESSELTPLTEPACIGGWPQPGGEISFPKLQLLLSRLSRDEEAAYARRAVRYCRRHSCAALLLLPSQPCGMLVSQPTPLAWLHGAHALCSRQPMILPMSTHSARPPSHLSS